MTDDRDEPLTFVARAGKSRPRPPQPTPLSGHIASAIVDARSEGYSFKDATVVDVEVRGGSFHDYYDVRSTFDRCTFRGTKFSGGSFGSVRDWERQIVYRDCLFDGVRIGRGVRWSDVRFERCEFRNVRIDGMVSRQGEFIDCVFSGRLVDCDFEATSERVPNAIRRTNAFYGNDFSQADLIRGGFLLGIDLDTQRLPEGEDYVVIDHPEARAALVERAVNGWPPSTDRDLALGWLEDFHWRPLAAQRKRLIRVSETLDGHPALRDRLLRELQHVRLD